VGNGVKFCYFFPLPQHVPHVPGAGYGLRTDFGPDAPDHVAQGLRGEFPFHAHVKSVFFREMFLSFKKQQLKEEFRELQAQQKGVFTESDVEKLVFVGP
jgi:hypothetical protein